jgi:hypothetical protein
MTNAESTVLWRKCVQVEHGPQIDGSFAFTDEGESGRTSCHHRRNPWNSLPYQFPTSFSFAKFPSPITIILRAYQIWEYSRKNKGGGSTLEPADVTPITCGERRAPVLPERARHRASGFSNWKRGFVAPSDGLPDARMRCFRAWQQSGQVQHGTRHSPEHDFVPTNR